MSGNKTLYVNNIDREEQEKICSVRGHQPSNVLIPEDKQKKVCKWCCEEYSESSSTVIDYTQNGNKDE